MKEKLKRFLSFLLIFMFIFSFNIVQNINYKAFAKENDKNTIKLNVRIEANDHTIISKREVILNNFDLKPYGSLENPSDVKAIHAIIKALESEDINCKDKSKFNSRGCTYIENINGLKEGNVSQNSGWMYYINNKYVPEYVNNASIKDGDNLVVFFNEDYTKSMYSWFDKEYIKTKVGENISLKLNSSKDDRILNVDNARILVNNKPIISNGKYITTNNNGEVILNFDKEGVYEISSEKFDKSINLRNISRPYCKVVVEKGKVNLNKEEIEKSLNDANQILNSAKEGNEVGSYSKESIDLLKKSINNTKEALEKENLTKNDIENLNVKLQQSIFKFKESVNKNESLQKIINDISSLYNKESSFDFITSMALRNSKYDMDVLSAKVNIYNNSNIVNCSRNIINIIAIGKNPFDYKNQNYIEKLMSNEFMKNGEFNETKSQNIALAIIALDMANAKYDKEKIVNQLLKNAHDEGNDKISFGEMIKVEDDYDDFGDFFAPRGRMNARGADSEYEYNASLEGTLWSLIALSNHKDMKNVNKIINKAKNFVKLKQNSDGLIEDCFNTALTIQAIIALDENSNSDYWCKEKNGEKIYLKDAILKCKRDNGFANNIKESVLGRVTNGCTSYALAALTDLNSQSSMYKKIKFQKVNSPIRLKVDGKHDIYVGETTKLTVKAYDYNNFIVSEPAIKWESSNENIVSINNGEIEGINAGEAEVYAYINGHKIIKDSIKIKVNNPPKIDYTNKINEEIQFLKKHYEAYNQYEFLATSSAIFAGIDKENIKNNICKYSKCSTAFINAKIIITLEGAQLDASKQLIDNSKKNGNDYVTNLKNSQVKDGENKGKFIINKFSDSNSIEGQAYSIIALDLVNAKYNEEDACKALLNILKNKDKDTSYKNIKSEAIAATALAKHKNVEGVQNQINLLIKYFKEQQNKDGAFDLVSGSTFINSPVASSAVITALLANNIDPLSWKWIKNGHSILDGILKSKFVGRNDSNSGYSQGSGSNFENYEASYYTFCALVELSNKKCIFDMMRQNSIHNIKNYSETINNIVDDIANKNISNPESWYIIELNKLGKTLPNKCLDKIRSKIKKINNESIDIIDYEKIIMQILALGQDPTNIEGYNLIPIIYNGDLDAINSKIFGLIALDSGNFYVPKQCKWTREKLVKSILNERNKDGGWSFIGNISDVDMTAMVISALAPYYNQNNLVKSAINEALKYLSNVQLENGGFKSNNNENSNSIAMVIIALTSLNIDLTKDNRFIKNNNNVLDALLKYKTKNNEFGFLNNKSKNNLSTEQAFRALISYKNFKNGKSPIYKFNFDDKLNNLNIKNLTNEKDLKLNSNAKINIEVKNKGIKPKKVTLITNVFTKNGKLINCNHVEEVVNKDEVKNLINSIKIPENGEYLIKVFLWDSIQDMNSYMEPLEIHIK